MRLVPLTPIVPVAPVSGSAAQRARGRLGRVGLAVAVAAALLAGCAQAPRTLATPAEANTSSSLVVTAGAVQVEFVRPQDFSDVGDPRPASAAANRALLLRLGEALARSAGGRLAPGQQLQLRITDIDQAGQAEPWRWRAPDTRIVRDLYPPRIDLDFRVIDAAGATLESGERQLRDLGFMMASTSRLDGDPWRHEKRLLERWLAREFAPAS